MSLAQAAVFYFYNLLLSRLWSRSKYVPGECAVGFNITRDGLAPCLLGSRFV